MREAQQTPRYYLPPQRRSIFTLPAEVKKRGRKKIEDLNYPSSVRVVREVRGSYSSVRGH
jgi:hypothetical protein